MTNITQLQKYNTNRALARLVRYSKPWPLVGVHKRVDQMNACAEEGICSISTKVQKYKFNRRKYNRMYYAEQEIYEKKMLEEKTVYQIEIDDFILFITKTEHLYLSNLINQN